MANVKVNVEPRIDPRVKVYPACGRHREAPEPEVTAFHEDLERQTRQAWKDVQEEKAKAKARAELVASAKKREEAAAAKADKPKKAAKKTGIFKRKKGKR
jgi:hypothetical protein